jgi:iron transport multicopper oxidase
MVEAPLELQKLFGGSEKGIPSDHFDACKVGGVPVVGNAAGNTLDVLNLDGENAPPDPLPDG